MGDSMTHQFDVLALVTARLDDAGIAYMVTGSMAAGYYGHPCMTRGVDIVVELRPGDPERLEALLSDAFLLSADTARGAMANETMFNAIHREAIVKVDFVMRKSAAFRIEEFGRRHRLDWNYLEAWAATLGLADALKEVRA